MNIYIFGALLTLRIQFSRTRCKEGAKYVNVQVSEKSVISNHAMDSLLIPFFTKVRKW